MLPDCLARVVIPGSTVIPAGAAVYWCATTWRHRTISGIPGKGTTVSLRIPVHYSEGKKKITIIPPYPPLQKGGKGGFDVNLFNSVTIASSKDAPGAARLC